MIPIVKTQEPVARKKCAWEISDPSGFRFIGTYTFKVNNCQLPVFLPMKPYTSFTQVMSIVEYFGF